jgi:hypothetical protein
MRAFATIALGLLTARSALAAASAGSPGDSPPADAVESSTPPPATGLETTVNGYLDTRFTAQHVRGDAPLPATDVPKLANMTEGNFQLKLRWGQSGFALADASFVFQRAGDYPGPDHDVPAYRPFAVISELYASYAPSEHLNVTVGKKRVVWGSGMFINPMDLLNPPKDPTDPSLQRAGAWLARLELPYRRFTVSLLGAAQVLTEYGGVPADLVVYPSYDTSPAQSGVHAAAAARLYTLVFDTDVNVEYVFTNLYNDAFREKSRVGFSLSRLVGKSTEVHVEALGQLGTARLFVDPACTTDGAAAATCQASGVPLVAATKLGARTPVFRGIAGARYTFGDDSVLSIDHVLFTDGYSDAEWRSFLQALSVPQAAPGLLAAAGVGGAGAGGSAGTPQKFVFQPLRSHYLFVSYSKPRIKDDFTLNLTLIAALQDLSSQLAPQLVWQPRDWISIAAEAFISIPGARPTEVNGVQYSELRLSPADQRGLVSVRVFY